VHTNMNIPVLEPLPHHPYIEYLEEVRQCQKDYSTAYKNAVCCCLLLFVVVVCFFPCFLFSVCFGIIPFCVFDWIG
jgi:hypothetical protein